MSFVTGDLSGTAPGTGQIGEELKANGAATAATGAQTSIATKTFTTGAWSITATLFHDNNVGVAGIDVFLYKKGSNSAVYAYDHVGSRVATSNSLSFPEQELIVASGDADKTVEVKAQATGGASDCTAEIIGVRKA